MTLSIFKMSLTSDPPSPSSLFQWQGVHMCALTQQMHLPPSLHGTWQDAQTYNREPISLCHVLSISIVFFLISITYLALQSDGWSPKARWHVRRGGSGDEDGWAPVRIKREKRREWEREGRREGGREEKLREGGEEKRRSWGIREGVLVAYEYRG